MLWVWGFGPYSFHEARRGMERRVIIQVSVEAEWPAGVGPRQVINANKELIAAGKYFLPRGVELGDREELCEDIRYF